jgi:hypothetical protein
MLPLIHSIRRVHHRSSHEYLRVVTVWGEGKGETVVGDSHKGPLNNQGKPA